jgi:hypothetical protein
MTEIVNLRRARKLRDRATKADMAAENRARFGRSKADKANEAATAALQARQLDGVKRLDGVEGEADCDEPSISGDTSGRDGAK